jgi:outer membrane protein assembly factor BamD (BamD/ComL family)
MLKRILIFIVAIFAFTTSFNKLQAQPTWTFEPFGKEKKPEQYENRKLGSEKTADKKFTVSRRFIQNNVTHYNYYFNCNAKIDRVVERAKLENKDDYSQLLSFYPYKLTSTSGQKIDLDSVIYSSTAGILLHDLRSDWVDNMYLLIGKAYFYRKDFDSAALTFQFINYNLFPRKKKDDDDDKVIGTNASASGGSISIANKEKQTFLQKIMSLPPSRNDALIWYARTLIEQQEFGEAAGLINTLQNDPNLPKRLKNDLAEVTSYWNFKQNNYDSAAVYLEKALTAADTKEDKSRWEYLLGQLYEMNGNFDKASLYYGKASKHTVDPLMDINAQLNEAKMFKGSGNIKELNNSIANLLKMARKDKFDAYRDIIYYSAGQLALQRPDTANALIYYNKSLNYNENNTHYKNLAFLQLGDIAYKQKQYRLAAAMYDSLQVSDSTLAKRIADVQDRKNALLQIVDNITIIEREDSLQALASLSPADRDATIKKLLKKYRKEQGLKELLDNNNGFAAPNDKNAPPDLFNTNTKGDWYFYNPSLKGRGFNEFKSRWGSRANVDNWRRKSATEIAGGKPQPVDPNKDNSKGNKNATQASAELTYDGLMANLPLSPERIDTSNSLIASSLLALAKLYQSDLEDYEQAAITYEEYLKRFPTKLQNGEVYLGLYYSYTKLGNIAKADYYKNLLSTKFAGTTFAQMANNPTAVTAKTTDATKLYENIYNQFIEGNFETAISEKKKADSMYGKNYWTPQLLFIESIYNIRQHNDSIAIVGLKNIISTYPSSALKAKAETMIDVLGRRKEIEDYLTKLQITRATEETVLQMQNDKVVKPSTPVTPTTPKVVAPAVVRNTPKIDTVKMVEPLKSASFKLMPYAPHFVVMLLDKVDGVYVGEAQNAFNRYNKENYYGQPITIKKEVLDVDKNLLVISSFENADAAIVYADKIKRDAKSEVSWLPAAKYSFFIITAENLDILKGNKNITEYKKLLNTQYPNKF